jgi:lactoylglutathione lyase
MDAKIDQVGILTAQFDKMVAFYRDILGFKVKLQLDGHAEFESPGVRFAIGTLEIMADITNHPSFTEEKNGISSPWRSA